MTSLRSVEIRGVKTSELLNLTFRNVPSLTSLTIERYNFSLFPNKPFRELINLFELYLTNGKLKVLPEDLFYNLHNLTKLALDNNYIESIHPLVFRNLTKLEYLHLGSNQIKDLPGDTLKGLFNLRTFSIIKNRQLSEIPSGFFKKLHNLTEFSAWDCSIYSLEDDVFSDLINLNYVDLNSNKIKHLPPNLLRNNKLLTKFSCSFNRISTLPTGIFHGLSELRWLTLRGNRLENLPEDVRQNLSSLKTFILSSNSLTLLHENVFLPLINLTDLDLSDKKYGFQMPTYYLRYNEITCNYELQQFVSALKSNIEIAKKMFPDIENTKCFGEERNLLDNTSLVVIGNYCPMNCDCFAEQNHVMVNCSGKGIDRIPEVLVPNATIVDLSNNYIKELSDIDCVTWRYVTHLRLSNNSLIYISDYILLPNLKYLWLKENRLTQFSSGLMNLVDVSSEFKVYLSRNNWNCHCHSQFTKDWLLRNRQKIADFSDVFCARNSSSLSFTEIASNDGCTEIPEINLSSSVNASSSNEY
ncbi:carboxypeptidase N subunit 2-like [Centruroides vittatus]|uniref:carboxypeptidase N subunit 2-like n=1 Tax=Centruroides vittatus TaxID=120091 RepID=UPI00350FEEBD